MATLDIGKADVVEQIVARCVASKTWRSECLRECLAFASKPERKVVEEYVRSQYDAAGAGFAGRWQ